MSEFCKEGKTSRGRPTGRPLNSFHIVVNELFLIIKNRVKNASVKKRKELKDKTANIQQLIKQKA